MIDQLAVVRSFPRDRGRKLSLAAHLHDIATTTKQKSKNYGEDMYEFKARKSTNGPVAESGVIVVDPGSSRRILLDERDRGKDAFSAKTSVEEGTRPTPVSENLDRAVKWHLLR